MQNYNLYILIIFMNIVNTSRDYVFHYSIDFHKVFL